MTHWAPEFSKQNMQILKEETAFQGVCQMKRLQIQFPRFDEGFCTTHREVLVRDPAVAVLPYDPGKQCVVLIEQIRIGAYNSPQSPWLLEIVAGIKEPNESYEATAYRETLEESGLEILSLHPICHYFVSPGISTEQTRLYCGIIKTPDTYSIQGLVEESENIKVHEVPFEEAYRWVQLGIINSASAVIALQWLALNQSALNSLR